MFLKPHYIFSDLIFFFIKTGKVHSTYIAKRHKRIYKDTTIINENVEIINKSENNNLTTF